MFKNILEKTEALSQYTNSPIHRIVYVPVRNMFIDLENEKEYNILTKEEAFSQARINLQDDFEQDCVMCNLNVLSIIVKQDLSTLQQLFKTEEDFVEFNENVLLFIESNMSLNEYFDKVIENSFIPSFLSCNYEITANINGFDIYFWEHFSGF